MVLVAFLQVSGGELLIIALVALVVLGPERLPVAFRRGGEVLGQLRTLSEGFRREMQAAMELPGEPIVKPQSRSHLSPVPDPAASATPVEDGADPPAGDAQASDTQASDTQASDTQREQAPGDGPEDGTTAPRATAAEPGEDAP